MILRAAVLVGVLLLLSPASTELFHFTMSLNGTCSGTSSLTCTAKGTSQEQTTLVAPSDDAVRYWVRPSIGSFAQLHSVTTFGPNGPVEVGNVTFGTHLAPNHRLDYASVAGSAINATNGEVYGSVIAAAQGGSGAFANAQGLLTENIRQMGQNVEIFLSVRVYIP